MDEDCSSTISKDEDQVKEIVARNDKDEFLSFLERSSVVNSGDLVKLRFGQSEICPYKILGWICYHGATHCGTALLEGKIGLEMDLNVPIHPGVPPLHEVAYSLSAGLIDLFLRHGANADVKCDAVESEYNGLLPLHIALERVSSDKNLIQWLPSQSIFKLIIMLCLPKMKGALETNRLLACRTKEVKEVIRYFTKEGKLIELAILLMVAREKVMGPIIFQSKDDPTIKGCMSFRKCINSELAALIAEECRKMGLKKHKKEVRTLKEKKVTLMSTLLLLEIFERAGDIIEAFLRTKRTNASKEQVAQEVGMLLADAGFLLKSEDTDLSDVVDWYPAEMVLEHSDDFVQEQKEPSGELTECGSQRHDIRMPFNLQPRTLFDRNETIDVMPIDLWGLTRTRFPRESSNLSSAVRPFNAFWVSKANYCTGFPRTMERMKERTKGIELCGQHIYLCRQWASIALAFKRGIRCIKFSQVPF